MMAPLALLKRGATTAATTATAVVLQAMAL
jgi:hypothetical protein